MRDNDWSPMLTCQKRIIRDLFAEIAKLQAQNEALTKRIASVEKGQVVDLKRLEKALGISDDAGGEV